MPIRQYRSVNPCGDGESVRCADAFAQDVTMLGSEQEQWVQRGFARSGTAWNLIGQQLLLAELEHPPYEDERYWNDAWDGYPGARQRLVHAAVETAIANPVFCTGVIGPRGSAHRRFEIADGNGTNSVRIGPAASSLVDRSAEREGFQDVARQAGSESTHSRNGSDRGSNRLNGRWFRHGRSSSFTVADGCSRHGRLAARAGSVQAMTRCSVVTLP